MSICGINFHPNPNYSGFPDNRIEWLIMEAEDTRLGRLVALEFLPDHFARDHAALQRFQLEAHAASALNHGRVKTNYRLQRHRKFGQEHCSAECLPRLREPRASLWIMSCRVPRPQGRN
jgi:hypothetical protein